MSICSHAAIHKTIFFKENLENIIIQNSQLTQRSSLDFQHQVALVLAALRLGDNDDA